MAADLIVASRQYMHACDPHDEPIIILVIGRKGLRCRVDVPDSPTATVLHKDGPEAPDLLWWRGRSVPISQKQYRVLTILWHERTVELAEFRQHVWGDEQPTEAAVRNILSRCNNLLLEVGCIWQISIRSGYVLIG